MLDIKKQIKKYFILSIVVLIISIIYELFSHGVISYYMILSFLIPLIMGTGIYYLIYKINKKSIYKLPSQIYNSSILTFLLYFILNGILEIYGTTNNKINIYLLLGFLLLITSIILNIYYKKIKIKN